MMETLIQGDWMGQVAHFYKLQHTYEIGNF